MTQAGELGIAGARGAAAKSVSSRGVRESIAIVLRACEASVHSGASV
jgi:hypothetical protein